MAKSVVTNTNNCFQNVLSNLALTSTSEDNGADLAYFVLSIEAANLAELITASSTTGPQGGASGDDYTIADTYSNQMQEVLHRLRPYYGFAWKKLCAFFNDFDDSVGEPQ
jgi:hypothetical protein